MVLGSCCVISLSLPRPYGAFNLALRIPLGNRIPLIIQLLTTAKTQFDLRFPTLQVKFERNKRQSFGIYSAPQLTDLAPVQQQFAIAHRLMIIAIAVLINSDMCIL